MKKINSLFLAVFFVAFALNIFAQEITPSQITMDAVKIISFTERAGYDMANPFPREMRFIKQGEDRERGYQFMPQPVSPDAAKFDVELPMGSSRAPSPAPTASFNGTLDNGTLIPPDIRGAAGSTYVMETTNQEFKILTKSGTAVSTVSITTFFAATGGSGYFDPHILYDANNSRWIVCITGTHSNGNGGIFIGVSQTDNPTGSWYVYSFDGIGNANDFLDFPLLGYNANWVVITGNDFLAAGGTTGKIYVMNRASLYAGTLGTVSTFTDANVFSLAPAQTMDAAQATLYMVQNWNGNSGGYGYVRVGKITGTPTAPVYTAGSLLSVNQPWSNSTITVPQLGSTQKIEGGDSRVGNAVYINGSLWFCQTAFLPASGPSRTAAQWWQVNPATPAVQQFGRVDGGSSSGTMYFYPGIAVNSSGDVLLGHAQTSSSSYASASYSTRASADAANTMQTPYMFKAGVASYYKTYGGTRNRWGDYTGASVDPSNNSFWNFNEWANTTNKWGTAIANVSLTPAVPCDPATGLGTSGIGDNTATFNWTAVAGAVSYNVQYRAVGAGSWTTTNTTATSFTALGLAAGTNHEWQVQTVCATGTSAFTASTNFTTTGTVPCNTPTGLSTSSVTTTTATFNWGAVSGALSYNVQYRIVGAGVWTTATASGTSYNATGLTVTSNYEWQVQTVCSASTSGFSALATFTTLTPSTCTDNYESNNTSSTSKTIPFNTDLTGFISPSTDVDWFKFTTVSPNIKVKVDLTNLPADYDMALYRSNTSTRVGLSQNSGTTNEQIKYNASRTYNYYLKVYGYSGANSATQCYKLRVSVSSTSWAPELSAAETNNGKEDIIEAEPVMKIYPNPAQDRLTVEFIGSNGEKANLSVYNISGQKVLTGFASVTEGLNTQTIFTNTLSAGTYIFEIENNGETQRMKFTIDK